MISKTLGRPVVWAHIFGGPKTKTERRVMAAQMTGRWTGRRFRFKVIERGNRGNATRVSKRFIDVSRSRVELLGESGDGDVILTAL
jgi:hypothetical protein